MTDDPPVLLRRGQVARRLGYSRGHVHWLEKQGRLPVYEIRNGTHWFSLADVERYKAANPRDPYRGGKPPKPPRVQSPEILSRWGIQDAAVLRCFKRGLSLDETVEETHIAIERVLNLFDHYKRGLVDKRDERAAAKIVSESRRREYEEFQKEMTEKRLEIRRLELETEKLRALNGTSTTHGESSPTGRVFGKR